MLDYALKITIDGVVADLPSTSRVYCAVKAQGEFPYKIQIFGSISESYEDPEIIGRFKN